MADSIPQAVRNIVGKLSPSTSTDDAVKYFWSRAGGQAKYSEDQQDKLDRQVRKCHQENVKAAGRAALGFEAEG